MPEGERSEIELMVGRTSAEGSRSFATTEETVPGFCPWGNTAPSTHRSA
jgi:hypothetical protein